MSSRRISTTSLRTAGALAETRLWGEEVVDEDEAFADEDDIDDDLDEDELESENIFDEEAEDFEDDELLDEDQEEFDDNEGISEGWPYDVIGEVSEEDDEDEELYEALLEEASALSRMPEELKPIPEWRQAYAEGVSLADVVTLLGPEFETLTDEEAESLVAEAIAEMSTEEAEGFLKSLGRIASRALPAIGGAVGTAIAPGVGTAVGGALGGLAGKALGAAARGRRRPRRKLPRRRTYVRGRRRRLLRGRRRPGRRVSIPRARTELLRLIQNPQFLRALTSSILGGRGVARAGDEVVSVGAFLETLSWYAQEAAAEAHEEMLDNRAAGVGSLSDASLDAGDRAQALMDLLDDTPGL